MEKLTKKEFGWFAFHRCLGFSAVSETSRQTEGQPYSHLQVINSPQKPVITVLLFLIMPDELALYSWLF